MPKTLCCRTTDYRRSVGYDQEGRCVLALLLCPVGSRSSVPARRSTERSVHVLLDKCGGTHRSSRTYRIHRQVFRRTMEMATWSTKQQERTRTFYCVKRKRISRELEMSSPGNLHFETR